MKVHEILKENEELPQDLIDQLEQRAADERDGGGSIEIDSMLPTVAITLSDGSEYFFQEHEADDLLNGVPDNINPEDYILAIAQNW